MKGSDHQHQNLTTGHVVEPFLKNRGKIPLELLPWQQWPFKDKLAVASGSWLGLSESVCLLIWRNISKRKVTLRRKAASNDPRTHTHTHTLSFHKVTYKFLQRILLTLISKNDIRTLKASPRCLRMTYLLLENQRHRIADKMEQISN